MAVKWPEWQYFTCFSLGRTEGREKGGREAGREGKKPKPIIKK
jgi:hypothetical protein